MKPLVYLLHFDTARHHARHYLGSTWDIAARLTRHATGRGAALTRALWLDGEKWTLAAIWQPRNGFNHGDRERRAKQRHNGASYCPLCGHSRAPPGCIQLPITEDLIQCLVSNGQSTALLTERRPTQKPPPPTLRTRWNELSQHLIQSTSSEGT